MILEGAFMMEGISIHSFHVLFTDVDRRMYSCSEYLYTICST